MSPFRAYIYLPASKFATWGGAPMRVSMLLMAVALAAVLVGDRHLLEIELSSIKDASILGGIVAGHVTRAVPQPVGPHARGDAPVEVR